VTVDGINSGLWGWLGLRTAKKDPPNKTGKSRSLIQWFITTLGRNYSSYPMCLAISGIAENAGLQAKNTRFQRVTNKANRDLYRGKHGYGDHHIRN
jgi:hypothetical protein